MKLMLSKKKIIVGGVAVAVIVVAIAAWLLFGRGPAGIPRSISSKVPYALYQPNGVIDGFKIDSASAKLTEEVVSYELVNGSQRIYVSEQKKPENFDFQAFHSAYLKNRKDFKNGDGEGAYGEMVSGEGFLGSFVGSSTWVLVTGPDENGAAISKIVQNLTL